ncbi:serine hydrolase domain-containing protein [Brevibacillus daliensis]|uniref:serine hydrolase domain-containing protein n=1 Tax=Brevibacillus daliensis TaxID=2892995 RepID=UPI001E40012B|nr:serine hydrolase domain-containing protein [Brevibacillus daliensis]
MNMATSFLNFEDYAKTLIEEFKLPGASIGIAKGGELVYEKNIGFRDPAGELPITIDTVFGIGSITKSMTCVAIMQLQEAGKLSVHDSVVTYLPEFRIRGSEWTEKMTIHHLMTHSTGLPPLPTLFNATQRSMMEDKESLENEDYKEIATLKPIDTYEELLDFIAELEIELLGEPGVEFSYSNDSYALLGAIIERVSGQLYEVYMRENILEPIGMINSVFLPQELDQLQEVAPLYTPRKTKDGTEVVYSPNWWESPVMRAAGFLKSTVRDMLRYIEIFRLHGSMENTQILSADSVAEMIKPHMQVDRDRFYGYGLAVTPNYHGVTMIEHGGGIKGVAAQIFFTPEHSLTGVVLTNLDGGPSKQLMIGALNSLQGRHMDALPGTYYDYPLEKECISDYFGRYESGEGEKVEIRMEGESLVLVCGEDSYPLRSVAEDSFIFIRGRLNVAIRFIRNASQTVHRLSYGSRQLAKMSLHS